MDLKSMWNSSFRHLSFIYSFSFFPLRSPCSLQTTMAKSPWLSSPITTATSGNSLPFFLGYTSASCVLCLCCNFFFFFLEEACFYDFMSHQWVSCIVYGIHKPLFSAIFSLKMGLTVLFTHLEIILL